MYKSYGNKNTNLDEVNLNISNSNMFAIMLEQDDGTYKEDTSNKWPTNGYKYNESMSGCININGNKLDGVLTYDSTNNIATIDTGNTSYCYLYFSIKPWCEGYATAGECLLQNPTNGLVTTSLQGEIYRYQGVNNVNNYICFGTSDKNECTSDIDTYMYRIIGITSDNKLKLIKKTQMGRYVWTADYTTDVPWANSDLYKGLNGDLFLDDSSYVTNGWENKIATVDWKYGKINDYDNFNAAENYAVEDGWTTTIASKIGLMYIHDYLYAYPGGIPGNIAIAFTAWIHASNDGNNINYFVGDEWFLSKFINNDMSMLLYSDGSINAEDVDFEHGFRPVFYLESNIAISSGTGTEDDPFIIN